LEHLVSTSWTTSRPSCWYSWFFFTGGPKFQPQFGNRLYWLRLFVAFMQIIGHDHFLPYPFSIHRTQSS
jgi:hypothetical protein